MSDTGNPEQGPNEDADPDLEWMADAGLDADDTWGVSDDDDTWGVSDDDNGDNNNDTWGIGDITRDAREYLTLGSLFIIRLDSSDSDRVKPFLCKLLTVEPDMTVHFQDENDKVIIFEYEMNSIKTIKMKTDNYKILEIIRVRIFDVSKEDYGMEDEEIEFFVEELKDKQYSDLLQRDDLLSCLIRSYDCYETRMLEQMDEIIDAIFTMIRDTDDTELSLNLKSIDNNKIPFGFIPVTDDSLKFYNYEIEPGVTTNIPDGHDISEEIHDEVSTYETGSNEYRSLIVNNIQNSDPLKVSTGVGYTTNEYEGPLLRNCITEGSLCEGINGSYMYDERRTKHKLKIPRIRETSLKEEYTELETILSSDIFTVTGLLEEPVNKMYFSYDMMLSQKYRINEKIKISQAIETMNKKKLFEKISILERMLDNGSLLDKMRKDVFLKHNMTKTLTKDDFFKLLKTEVNTRNNVLESLLSLDNIKDKILNYRDLDQCLTKYDLHYNDFRDDIRIKINRQVSQNIRLYVRNYRKSVKYKLTKNLTIKRKPLTDDNRVKLASDYIFSLYKQDEKNYYLKKFIELFSRKADKVSENPHYLYNKNNDKQLLCRHHLYSCEITNENNVFQTMKDMFGSLPIDGIIHCKTCGEALCLEDFSNFEGFGSDDKPSRGGEILPAMSNQGKEIDDMVDKNEDIVHLIQTIAESIGVSFDNKSLYDIMITYDYMTNDILSDIRYEISGISTIDIHPRINKLIMKIKEKEKKSKDKTKKKEYKEEREKVMSDFQRWLKTTNKLLCYISIIVLFIQTSVPIMEIRKNINIQIFNPDTNELNSKGLQFVASKIKNLCQIYKQDKFWKDSYQLFEDSKYETNDIVRQIGQTILYCMSPTFPTIINRTSMYRKFLLSEKKNYLKEEWTTYKPLQNNVLVRDITEYLTSKEKDNIQYYKKLYSGYTVENVTLIRELDVSYNTPLVKECNIPQFEIIQNNSFMKLFRYVVSCYGKHQSCALITLLMNDFLDTIDKREECIKIVEKCGWSEENGGFTQLNFKDLRTKAIPEILGLYNKDDTNQLRSCYSNEDTCNNFIHNMINNYDLHLLNTHPKRIYGYKIPIIYPEDNYDNLKESIKDKIFAKYQLNQLNEITSEKNEMIVHKYSLGLRFNEFLIDEIETLIPLEKRKEHFEQILNYKRNKYSLIYQNINIPREIFNEEDYHSTQLYSVTEDRFIEFYESYPKELLTEEELLTFDAINDTFVNYINDISTNTKTNTKTNTVKLRKDKIKSLFSEVINMKNICLTKLCNFISHSDYITDDSKKRFALIFKIPSTGQEVRLRTDALLSIFNIFLDNEKCTSKTLITYLNDIYSLLSKLTKDTKLNSRKIPREWKTTQTVNNEFSDFLVREGLDETKGSYELLFHDSIFVPKKGLGFNTYQKENVKNKTYLLGMFQYLRDLFKNLDLLKGNKFYNETYERIYIQYHFCFVYSKMIDYIEGLMNDQSDITSDANQLYQSLDQRDENDLENSISICSTFVMDSLSNIMMTHYDPLWFFMNDGKTNILSKQKEREKQNIIQKLDGVSNEERFLIGERNKIGVSNFWKEANAEAAEAVKRQDYGELNEVERTEKIREIYGAAGLDIDSFAIPQLEGIDGGDEGGGYDNADDVDLDDQYDDDQE